MSNITLEEFTAFLVMIGSVIGAIGVIVKTIYKPVNKIESQLEKLDERVEKLDTKVDNLQEQFESRFNSLDEKQIKQARDMRMSLVINKYLLDMSTDTSEHGQKVRDEFNDYLLDHAVGGGSDNA